MKELWAAPDQGNITEINVDEATGTLLVTTDEGNVYVIDAERLPFAD